MECGKPFAYVERGMTEYKVHTLEKLISEIRICNAKNLPFIARSDDSGYVIAIEQSRKIHAIVLPDPDELTECRDEYNQDSIAITIGETEFI